MRGCAKGAPCPPPPSPPQPRTPFGAMPPAAPQLSPLVNAVVVPGDVVLSLSDFAASAAAAGGGAGAPPGAPPALRLGAALLQRDGDIFSSRAGVLRQTGAAKLWVEASAKRYIPSPDDTVVGVVVERHAEARIQGGCLRALRAHRYVSLQRHAHASSRRAAVGEGLLDCPAQLTADLPRARRVRRTSSLTSVVPSTRRCLRWLSKTPRAATGRT